MQVQILAPTTAAKTTADGLVVPGLNYERITFTASNLATTETASVLLVMPDGTFVPAMSVEGVSGAAGLTATNPSRTFYGGADYILTKLATAGAAGLWWAPVVGAGA